MVSTTIKTTTSDSNFDYYPDLRVIYKDQNHWIANSIVTETKVTRPLGNSARFVSPNKKIIITAMSGMFHFWYDTVGSLLRLAETIPNVEVIIDSSFMAMHLDKSFFDFFLKVLKDNSINYQVIDYKSLDSVVINNFYAYTRVDRIDDSPNVVYKYIKEYLDTSVVPFRTVYLSRRNMGQRDLTEANILPGLSFNHDYRIDDENRLEDYLRSLGVEIAVPEEFNSFEDQIKYFNEVKTIISLTSSGLTNAIFMQPRGTVIEFVTPLIITLFPDQHTNKTHAEEALHNLYSLISFGKSHNYVAMQNRWRSVDSLIEHIESTKILDRVLKDD